MTRWEAFTTVCSYLRAGLLGGEHTHQAEVTWELIIEVASFHYATTTLAACFDPDIDVPSDVRNYFESALALNKKRNEQILSTLARVAGLLNAIDIEPVLLKGAALLVEGIYPQPSMRILGDIDILIPKNRSAEACAALKAVGFDTKWSAVSPPTHHHLPMLLDPETGTGVELHTDVISRSADAVIATDWFCEMVRPVLFRGQRMLLPEPTRNVGHIIFHSEIFHELYTLNKVQLRHVIDLALLRARHEKAINWEELDRRFSAAGVGEVLATYLHLASELLGQAAPQLSHAPRRDAMTELRSTESRDGFHFQIERLQSTCDRLLTHSSFLQSELENTRSALAAISTSRSWGLAAPLRGIANVSRTLWRGLSR
ncbi:nucleotidyltransferase domain-containing protein [Bradyrhizobium erythrophlei]|uniref:Uncharacterized nucleotidyltransferase n=1 Tax=Bradyrhizobium erythrophlei TaxID=1437360 RepID=A0A1M5U8Z8_9BRAD|nr:nucleotidyltransferase family protein [Bradyrhizobium erythrophlei]SHH59454.1 Uncharacterised nucleotidyltransferase [Bradyrhizobium erythrophlei]